MEKGEPTLDEPKPEEPKPEKPKKGFADRELTKKILSAYVAELSKRDRYTLTENQCALLDFHTKKPGYHEAEQFEFAL